MSALVLMLLPWIRLALGAFLTLVFFALLRELETSDRYNVKYPHALRFGLTVALALAVFPWGWPLVPGWLALVLTGYLVLDPGTADDTPMQPLPTKWLRFWQVLTGRQEKLAIWSAYVEAFVLLLSLAVFAYTLRNG